MSTHPIAWAMTRSGRQVDLVHPTPEMIDFDDIATSLARQVRWCGHTITHIALPALSLAQHSIMVADLAARMAASGALDDTARHRVEAWGLLHDAHEAYLADVSRPAQRAMAIIADEVAPGRDAIVAEAMRTSRDRLDAAIAARAGLPWPLPPHLAEIIRRADDLVLSVEARGLMPAGVPTLLGGLSPMVPDAILAPAAARALFLTRLADCGIGLT